MIIQSIMIMKNKADKKNISIDINIEEDINIYGDESVMVNSIFNNLLTNAIKFSNKGENILITALKKKDFVEIIFKDNGIGIPEEIIRNIFNVKKSNSRQGTDGESGTGFGMPLVKKFINEFNGSIDIESSINIGTSIIIHLPLVKG